MDGFATPMQSTVTVTEATTKPATKLTGDVNGDGTVNIFDLVTVAGNFGQSSLAAPASVASEIELTTEQKHHIAIAIDQLAAQPERSSTEEKMVLGVLTSHTARKITHPNPTAS